MSYQQFAYIYDYLMADAPYDRWVDKINHELEHAQFDHPIQILDLACGTGELSIRLAKAGYNVTGVDLSDDMLLVASEKAKKENVHIPFFQQDMTDLQELGTFDVITIFCDSLNYLPSSEDVIKTFQRVYEHLKEEGLFLFDVHSPYKINKVFKHATYAFADEKVSYIWECFPGEYEHSVEHELTFFVANSKGTYDRFDELHKQRTYDMEDYFSFLNQAGFSIISTTADFTNNPPDTKSERIFFTCKK